MVHGNKKNNDQIAGGTGKRSSSRCQSQPAHLFFTLFTSRFYSTSDLRNTALTPILQNRLSRHNPNAEGLLRYTQYTGIKENTSLFYTLLRRAETAKKRAFENLLNANFSRAKALKLLDDKSDGAIGLESRHISQHYVRRKGYKRFLRYHWPKVTVVCHIKTHLFAACIVTRGPSNDSPQFAPAVIQASRFVHFKRLLADAGYDGEHNHRLCREELGIDETVIALNRRRSRKWPKGIYRRQMKEHFVKELYNQRWQIESAISQNKHIFGSALRARTKQSREHECFLRILTHNLMIIRRAT